MFPCSQYNGISVILAFQETELRNTGDPKYSHLNEELHVEISVFAPAADAYSRIGHALHQVKRFLVPVSTAKVYLYIN